MQLTHGVGAADKEFIPLVPHGALCRAHLQEADNAPSAVLAQLNPNA